jgi:hypothetical protein
MFGVPSVAGRPFGSDRGRVRVGAGGHPLIDHPRPRPLLMLLFVVHGTRYTCILIHAKKGPVISSSSHLPADASRWGYGVAVRAVRPVSR